MAVTCFKSTRRATVTRTRALACAFAAYGAFPAMSSAGSFDVLSCKASVADRSDAWSVSPLPATIEMTDLCGSGEPGSGGSVFSGGRSIRPVLPPPGPYFSPAGRIAALMFSAPSGASLSAITYERRLQSIDASWRVQLRSDSMLLESCQVPVGAFQCPDLTGGTFQASLPLGTDALDLAAWCIGGSCPYGAGPLRDFAAVIYSSIVTVEESIAPTAGAPVISGLTNGWVGAGSPSATFTGSDTLGLRRIELVDGATAVSSVPNAACVDWSVLPCSDTSVPGLGPGFGGSAPLTSLTDGSHQLQTRATDAAGNQALSSSVAVMVDRRAPLPVVVNKGGAINPDAVAFEWLTPADGGSPFTAARVKICTGPPEPTACRWETGPVQGTLPVALGPEGTVTTVQVELTDEAGNVGLSPAVEYRRDTAAPAAPQLALVLDSGPKRLINVATTETDVAEYAVKICRADSCTDSRRTANGRVDLDLPALGTYRVDVGLIDRAGNAGATSSVTVEHQPSPGFDDPRPNTMVLLKSPIKLRPRATVIDVAGTVQVNSASKITITVKGRPAARKRNVIYRATTTPTKLGRWSARLKLPRGVNRRHGVLVTVKATPLDGYLSSKISRRIRG